MTSYLIVVVSHSKHNRMERAVLPKNPRKRQHIGGEQLRVLRGRPRLVTEEFLQNNLEELKARAKAHEIQVRTTDHRLVDLETLQAAAPAALLPLPNPPLDSLARDKNPVYPPGFKYVPNLVADDTTVPQIVPAGEEPSLMKEARDETAESEPPPPPPPVDDTSPTGPVEPPPDDFDRIIDEATRAASEEEPPPPPSPSQPPEEKSSKRRRK